MSDAQKPLSQTTPRLPLSMLEKVLLLEAVMAENRCEETVCSDWRSEHCVCRVEFEELINAE